MDIKQAAIDGAKYIVDNKLKWVKYSFWEHDEDGKITGVCIAQAAAFAWKNINITEVNAKTSEDMRAHIIDELIEECGSDAVYEMVYVNNDSYTLNGVVQKLTS